MISITTKEKRNNEQPEELQEIKIITSPEAIKILTDQIRRQILWLLRGKTLTARQITEELKKQGFADEKVSIQKINYHLKLMENAELIKVAKEETLPDRPHMVVRYYKRLAPIYFIRFSPDMIKKDEKHYDKNSVKNVERVFKAFGYKLSREDAEELAKLLNKFEMEISNVFDKVSKKQLEPTGLDPDTLARYFKTLVYLEAYDSKEVRQCIEKIKSLLNKNKKNNNR